jgi:hypothetical protein
LEFILAKEAQPTDYFFLVRTDREVGSSTPPYISADFEMYARGSGLEVVRAIARTAILEDAMGKMSKKFAHSTVIDHLVAALPEAQEDAYIPYNGSIDVTDLNITRFFHYVHTSHRDRQHKDAVLNQVRDGYRSPDSALAELTTASNDNLLIANHANCIFNQDGYQIWPHPKKQDAQPGTERGQLWLRRIIRTSGARVIHPETRALLFDSLPKGAKAYGVQTLPLRYFSWGENIIDHDRPFHGSEMVLHKTFGYVEKGSEDFVPVVTDRSPEPPAKRSK